MLVCCGLVTLDVLQVVERLPGPDEKVVATGFELSFGGPAANAAATAVALGVPTILVTALGTGFVADLVRGALRDAGVGLVDLLDGAPAVPAVSTVLVTRATGERAVVSTNATRTGDLEHAARRVADRVLADAGALLVDGHHLGAARALAAHARRSDVPVVLDGGSWKPGLETLLMHVDHAVLSAVFRLPAPLAEPPGIAGSARPAHLARQGDLADEADLAPQHDRAGHDDLAAVARLGPRDVARSAGAGALRYRLADGSRGQVEPEDVAVGEMVDTLGAGDVLHGAFAARIVRGDDVVTSLRAGVRLATSSVRFQGARGWVGNVTS